MKDENGNIILCDYGCGLEANFIVAKKHCCSNHYTKCPSVKSKIGSKISKVINKRISDGTWTGGLTMFNKNRKRIHLVKEKKYHSKSHPAWNKGLTKETSDKVRQISNTIAEMYKNGTIAAKNFKMSVSAREKISEYQSRKLQDHENGFPHVKYYEVKNLQGTIYKVRGKWELNVANTLNFYGINWIKPKGISYVYDYKRHYIPDFYLTDTDEYIEVKGYYSKWDHIKLSCILEQYPKIRIYFLKEENYNLFVQKKQKLNQSMILTKNDCLV